MRRLLLTLALVPLAASMTSFSLIPIEEGQMSLAQSAEPGTEPAQSAPSQQAEGILAAIGANVRGLGLDTDGNLSDAEYTLDVNVREHNDSTPSSGVVVLGSTPAQSSGPKVRIDIVATTTPETAADICNCGDLFQVPMSYIVSEADLGLNADPAPSLRDALLKFIHDQREDMKSKALASQRKKKSDIEAERTCTSQTGRAKIRCLVELADSSDEDEAEEALERLEEEIVSLFDVDSPRKFKSALKDLDGRHVRDLKRKMEKMLEVADLNEQFARDKQNYDRDYRMIEAELNRADYIIAKNQRMAQRGGYVNWQELNWAMLTQQNLEYQLEDMNYWMRNAASDYQFKMSYRLAEAGVDRETENDIMSTVFGRQDGRSSTVASRGATSGANQFGSPQSGFSQGGTRGARSQLNQNGGINQFNDFNPQRNGMWNDIPGTVGYNEYNQPGQNYWQNNGMYMPRGRQDHRSFIAQLTGQGQYQSGVWHGQQGNFMDPRLQQQQNFNMQNNMIGNTRNQRGPIHGQ